MPSSKIRGAIRSVVESKGPKPMPMPTLPGPRPVVKPKVKGRTTTVKVKKSKPKNVGVGVGDYRKVGNVWKSRRFSVQQRRGFRRKDNIFGGPGDGRPTA